MSEETLLVAGTAALVAIVHALAGPDHYLPFIALARARGWSAQRTVGVTLACGSAHVAASAVLASLGVALGWTLGGLERLESWRGSLAGWLLVGFGLAYLAWGTRRALRHRPHSHWHSHADGTVHHHEHSHLGAHAHLHEASTHRTGALAQVTPWALFLIFVLGPCEPLIPMLMVPAASRSGAGVVLIATVYALATLATMTAVVLAGRLGAARLPGGAWQRWSHAAAGVVIAACGLAIHLGL